VDSKSPLVEWGDASLAQSLASVLRKFSSGKEGLLMHSQQAGKRGPPAIWCGQNAVKHFSVRVNKQSMLIDNLPFMAKEELSFDCGI